MKRLDREKLAAAIEQRAERDLLEAHVGGATVMVAQAGEVVYQNHFFEKNSPWQGLGDHTLFRLASMTKPITAAATLLLVERGVLALEDTVDRFYPAFAAMQVHCADGTLTQANNKITVKSLLTHSSGIGCGAVWNANVGKWITQADKESVESYVAFLSRLPLSFEPETKQEYSGTGAFSVLTGIVQKVTDMPMEDFLRREIFTPCCMQDATFLPTEAQWARLVPMHDRAEGKSVLGKTWAGCVFETTPAQNFLGGAGLIAGAQDYLHFAQMLLNGGVFEGRRVLAEASVAALSKPRVFKKESESWGLGVRVITKQAPLTVGSYGWSGAYGTHFWVDPTEQIIGLYMKNSRYDGGSGAVTSRNFENDVYQALQDGEKAVQV